MVVPVRVLLPQMTVRVCAPPITKVLCVKQQNNVPLVETDNRVQMVATLPVRLPQTIAVVPVPLGLLGPSVKQKTRVFHNRLISTRIYQIVDSWT